MEHHGDSTTDASELDALLESQLKMEEDGDMSLLESIVFPDREKTYNELDHKTSLNVLQAMNETETGSKHPVFFQCDHCDEVFTFENFTKHVCSYDENRKPIHLLEVQENDIQRGHRYVMQQLEESQSAIRDILQKFSDKDSNLSRPVECRICCRKFVHETGLYRHWDKHIGEILEPSPENLGIKQAIPVCTICGELQGSEIACWLHFEARHLTVVDSVTSMTPGGSVLEGSQVNEKMQKGSENECDFCDAVFASSKVMLKHVSLHSASSGFHCECCELKNMNFKQVLLHRRDDCLNFKDYRNQLKDFPRVWSCNVCDEEFRGVEQLFEHRYKNHHYFPRIDHRTNDLAFSCEQCLVVFGNAPQLVQHFNEKHSKKPKEDAVSATSERIAKSSTSRRGGSHQTSTRPRQYLCEVCGKSYTQSSHLWQHLRFHQGVKPFECTEDGCDRRFTIRPDLNDHIRKCHTGERPFLCTLCGKRFLTGSVYYQHRLIHRGERRYGCDECDKRFYRADALKNHMRIHTGEKPHECSACGKKFRQRGDRDKHIKARHPDALIVPSPKRERVKSFGRGRVKNNTSLYQSMPDA